MKNGIGSHQSQKMQNDEWITPQHIINALGEFDLDPCASVIRPWDTAKKHYTIEDNGLIKRWHGRIWLNPPYGKYTYLWLDKLALHGNGIALVFARTETTMFFNSVWPHATAILFIKGRLFFHYNTGERAKVNAGAPSCLIAYGNENAQTLSESRIKGKFFYISKSPGG